MKWLEGLFNQGAGIIIVIALLFIAGATYGLMDAGIHWTAGLLSIVLGGGLPGAMILYAILSYKGKVR